MARRGPGQRLAALAVIGAAAGCHDAGPATVPDRSQRHEHELAALHTFEDQRRAAMDFATLPTSEVALGPDPYRIAALPDGALVGILRGASAVVLLDRDGNEQARLAAPRSPSGLAVSPTGDLFVVGDAARELAQYRVEDGRLARVATLAIDALGLRDVALAPDGTTAYLVEERDGRLLAVALPAARHAPRALPTVAHPAVRELGRCHGPLRVAAIAGYVAVDCLLDHTIEIRQGTSPPVRIHHDGPLWSAAIVRAPDGGALIAAGGVEDHPLERDDGGFGYIDSYLYLYRLAPGAAQPERLAAINSSALGVVTPKWITVERDGDSVAMTTAGYATAGSLTLTWRGGDFAAPPAIARGELPPGTTAALRTRDGALAAADPLLDAWIIARGGAPRIVAAAGTSRERPALSRLGEALFFTTMMAPWNTAEGKLSRFTCETCHHEGYVDGRTHFTGRGRVFATTRPLYGLFNNRPYFSRALDPTMTGMVHAEFRVANRHNGRDPWFALSRTDVPWLDLVADAPPSLSPEVLRKAFMTFLMDFTHRPNPAAIDHTRFTDLERAGAQRFAEHCASCHAARLIADDPASLVPFERWESLVLSPAGPIVWSDARYAKTAIEPYVHERGARVPTLRRLYKKWPYFTSGVARSLADVLDRFASAPGATYHDVAPADAVRLTADDKAALLAFLALL